MSNKIGHPLNNGFVNDKAIMVATYKALVNGRSKFFEEAPALRSGCEQPFSTRHM